MITLNEYLVQRSDDLTIDYFHYITAISVINQINKQTYSGIIIPYNEIIKFKSGFQRIEYYELGTGMVNLYDMCEGQYDYRSRNNKSSNLGLFVIYYIPAISDQSESYGVEWGKDFDELNRLFKEEKELLKVGSSVLLNDINWSDIKNYLNV